MSFDVLAEGLQFPEGPIAMPDGSVILVEIARGTPSAGVVRGNVDSLMKLVDALHEAGIELINAGAASPGGGRGVRLGAAPQRGPAA